MLSWLRHVSRENRIHSQPWSQPAMRSEYERETNTILDVKLRWSNSDAQDVGDPCGKKCAALIARWWLDLRRDGEDGLCIYSLL